MLVLPPGPSNVAMKHATVLVVLVSLILTACSSTESKQSVSDWGDNPLENPEFMEANLAYMTPGEEHAKLAAHAGSWNVRTKMFMTVDAEAVEMDATADSEMVLGGRFLVEEYHGTLMGEPFDGLLIVGFNKLTTEYFSVWMDTWGTAFHTARGSENGDGAIAMAGKIHDVLTPEGRTYRHVLREAGSGYVVELYDTLPDGTEWMVMEMTYTRRPAE